VHVYGRRTAVHVAFTPAEIREMAQLRDCCPIVDPKDLDLDQSQIKELEGPANAIRQKNIDILRSFINFPCGNRKKKFFLHFNRTPVEILGQTIVEKAKFVINQDGKPTDQFEEIACGSFFTSIGYVGMPIEGLPFLPQKGIVPNQSGRVLDGENPIQGLYVCGWIAHGASGVIGTNKLRAQETVHSLMEDLKNLPECLDPNTQDLLELLKSRGVVPVTFIDWKKIDAYEIMMGLNSGKPREKVTKIAQMVAVAKASEGK